MFGVIKIEEIRGKIEFYKLVVDGEVLLDQYESEIRKKPQYQKEYINIQAWMEECSNGRLLGKKKFNDLTNDGEDFTLYEFKSDHLRVYGTSLPGGKMILFGGYKNNQRNEIKQARRLAKRIKQEGIQR